MYSIKISGLRLENFLGANRCWHVRKILFHSTLKKSFAPIYGSLLVMYMYSQMTNSTLAMILYELFHAKKFFLSRLFPVSKIFKHHTNPNEKNISDSLRKQTVFKSQSIHCVTQLWPTERKRGTGIKNWSNKSNRAVNLDWTSSAE